MTDSKLLKYETLNKESLYQGFFQVNRYSFRHQLFEGGWSQVFQREIFERGHATGVLLLDPVRDMLVFVEQFRPGAVATQNNPWLLELVAGIIEKDESPDQVAEREADEEAGCHIRRLAKICEYLVSPGGSTEKIWLYLGEVDSSQISRYGGLVDENEDIKVHLMSVAEAFNRLENGQISNSMTLIALQWLKLNWDNKADFWL